jgi:putative DNA primase/helicase
LALSGSGTALDDGTQGVELLADARRVFDAGGPEMATKVFIAALGADEERPWATFSRGDQISYRDLAKLLRLFGIISRTVHPEGGASAKGYRRADFEDAWARYCSWP